MCKVWPFKATSLHPYPCYPLPPTIHPHLTNASSPNTCNGYKISLLDEELLASQKGLCSVESMQCVAVNSWWSEWMVVTYTEFFIFRIYDLYVLGKINIFIYSDVSLICQSRCTFSKSRWLSGSIISNYHLFCQNKLQKQQSFYEFLYFWWVV
jgi:hypothetical protein